MLPVLSSLIALQELDTAAEAARRRLAELPAAEQAIERGIAAVTIEVETAKAALAANQQSRRELEKQVAAIDTRLARFDDHKAAVKTNHEYTALLHEIATAKSEKDTVEEQILVLMEAADVLTADLTAAGRRLTEVGAKGEADRARLTDEVQTLTAELTRLRGEKAAQAAEVDAAVLAKYERILEQRKMVAVAAIRGELCTACHVRLRPAVTQQVRRNSDIVYCDSCQRILYAVPAQATADAVSAE